MGWLSTTVRRSLVLVLIAAVGGAVWSWRRDTADASTRGPAEWPPLPTPSPTVAPADLATVDTDVTEAATATTATTAAAAAATESTGGSADPLPDGSCPAGFPIKANANSGIFHVPGGRFYDRTKAERCYSDENAAIADGYRRAKN